MFFLVIHHRLRNAWIKPSTAHYPIEFVKLFCDELPLNEEISVRDKESIVESFSLKILTYENENILFEITKAFTRSKVIHRECFTLLIDKPFRLHEEILDAMESWTFVFSEQRIEEIKYLDGYRAYEFEPNVYVNVEDEKKEAQRNKMLADFFDDGAT